MKKSLLPVATFVVTLLVIQPATAQDTAESHAGMIMTNADAIEWGPGPASLPPGAKAALLEGHPDKAGPLTLRLHVPAGYEVRPHTHPVMEHLTVLSGSIHIGSGKAFKKEKATKMAKGGYVVMPKDMPHFAYTTEEAVFQLHSIGPWGITYLDPKDDPRNKTVGSN